MKKVIDLLMVFTFAIALPIFLTIIIVKPLSSLKLDGCHLAFYHCIGIGHIKKT